VSLPRPRPRFAAVAAEQTIGGIDMVRYAATVDGETDDIRRQGDALICHFRCRR